jgi:hypothetical protein
MNLKIVCLTMLCGVFACGGTSTNPAGSGTDAGTDAGQLFNTDPADCDAGTVGLASDATNTLVSGFGAIRVVSNSAEIVALETTMVVPAKPPASGTLFLWPGLQPLPTSANYDKLSNGVLQPVLTWGPTCAPNSPASPYASWWISAQYVNTVITSSNSNFAAYGGCHGGTGMSVAVGDTLHMQMSKSGTAWSQTVTDVNTSQSVTYNLDMLGQGQNFGEFVIEEPPPTPQAPVGDVIFTNSKVTLATGSADSCQPPQRGANDYFAAPHVSHDGTTCCYSRIVLRAQGVAATTPNGP